jgi:hypothetical protein
MKRLKANSKEISIYKKLQRALAQTQVLLDNIHSDMHGTYIAFNCKIYSGIVSQEALRQLVKEMKLPFRQSLQVLREFNNENRLENIFTHQLHREADGFKDMVNGSQYVSASYVRSLITEYSINYPSLESIEYPALRDKLKKVKSVIAGQAAIEAFFADSVIGFEHSSMMNPDQVFQFGRSGGWFALADAEDIREYNSRIEWYLKELFKTENGTLFFTPEDNETREQAQHAVNSNCDAESITKQCRAIEFFLNAGKEMVKSMKTESYFKEAVVEEIMTFVSELPATYTIKQEIEFIEGKTNLRTNLKSKSFIRRSAQDSRMIETSQGVKVSIREGLALYKELTKVVEGKKSKPALDKIGGFHIESFTKEDKEWVLKAGCHRITYQHIQRAIPTLTASA